MSANESRHEHAGAGAAAHRPPNWEETAPETLIPEGESSRDARTDRGATERERRIAERAHELAEARGFEPGHELDDWLQAEREIDAARPKQAPPEDQFTG